MDAATPSFAKEQLEETITTLVNAWLQMQRARHGDAHEADVNRFLNLSLHTVYELSAKEVIKDWRRAFPPLSQKKNCCHC
jgi:hypothetical protein